MSNNATMSIDQALAVIKTHLNLSSEMEWEVLEEIRTHLEEMLVQARHNNEDEQATFDTFFEEFGIESVGTQLQQVHERSETADALMLCILPIICTLFMRWLIYSGDGTAGGWQQLFDRPQTLVIALLLLIMPLFVLRRYQLAFFGWIIFWAISVIFMLFPAMRVW